jgi:hypothetical protein
MESMKKFAGVVLLILASGLVCAAQTLSTRTATYNFKGSQSSAGAVAGSPDTYFVTFTGQAQSTNNKLAVTIDVFNFTAIYVANNGVGTVVGGQWSGTTINKDRPPTTVGGTLPVGASFALKSDNQPAQGNFAVTFEAGDPSWPVFGNMIGSIDKSRPARAQGQLTLTYPILVK